MIKNKNKQKTWELQISDTIQYVLFLQPLLYSKWNVGDLNISEKSEFGHILTRDYFIYGSCVILKNNLIYLYSSQYWGSGDWLICPKGKTERNETTTSGLTQAPSHKISMPSFSRHARWLSWGDSECCQSSWLRWPWGHQEVPNPTMAPANWKWTKWLLEAFPWYSVLLRFLFTRKVHEAW